MHTKPRFKSRAASASRLTLERLEQRLVLAGNGLLAEACDPDSPALAQNPAARASQAVNCFAYDLYEHAQREPGNLLHSPLSISTALAMAYAGAAGETAEQMQDVLHFGSEPGIHAAFRSLFEALGVDGQGAPNYELALANAIWPADSVPIHEGYIQTVDEDYGGRAQNLDYSQPDQARDIINDWVEEQTQGKIEDLIDQLSPATAMVLTNSVYFKAFWGQPFDPRHTFDSDFHREDGTVVSAPMMTNQGVPGVAYSELDGFQVLELPYQDEKTSMVILLPQDGFTTEDLSPDTMVKVNAWLDDVPALPDCGVNITLPKFKTTVSTPLANVLSGMGMPQPFSGAADFSAMTDEQVRINRVNHKAFIEVNEQGTEAAAATFVDFFLCFAAGTPILTPDGEKPIEELKPGDYVLSRDEDNIEGEVQPKLVEKTFERFGDTMKLQVGGQIVRTTREHPFFVQAQGWTAAGELRPGDLLATHDGRWMEVEACEHSGEAETVYNLRVADHHTYFVGSKAWGFGLWTHNTYSDINFNADHPFHYVIRDNATSTMLFMGRVMDPTQTENEVEPGVAVEPDPLPGDADTDNDVDFGDFLILSQHYGKREDAVFAEGDFNGDGAIDFSDFLILRENYGTSRNSPEQVAAFAPVGDAGEY